MMRHRIISFSALSSEQIHIKSRWKSSEILLDTSAIVSFLSSIILRSSSIRSNQGEVREGFKSSSGMA
jgi:hypothetical protein